MTVTRKWITGVVSAVIGVTIALGVAKCEGHGSHPFVNVSRVEHVPPAFNIKWTQVPKRNQDFVCTLVRFRDQPTPEWVCVPYFLAPVP